MKTTTFILNCFIAFILCWASAIIVIVARQGAFILLEGKSLPAITLFLWSHRWMLLAAPMGWSIATLFLFVQKPTPEKTQFHISASVFLGVFMFSIYTVASLLPFLSLVTCACGYNLYDPHP